MIHQSEFLPMNSLKTQKKLCIQGAIGFGLVLLIGARFLSQSLSLAIAIA